MKYLEILLKGILIGFISIAIPGLSASTIAILLGIYYAMINSISSIFKDFKKSAAFLLSLIGGYTIGCLLGAFIVSTIYNVYPLPLICAILGLIIGSLPQMFKDLKPYYKKVSNWIVMIIVIALLVVYSYIIVKGEEVTFTDMNIKDYIALAVVGFVTSVTLVVPGVDFAVVLLSFGYYYAILNAISELMTLTNVLNNIICLGIYLVCYGLGAFLCSKVINKLFKKYEEKMRFANLGFILASPAIVVRKCIIDNSNFASTYSNKQLIVGIILFFFLALFMFVFYAVSQNDANDKAHKRKNMLRFFFMILRQPFKAIKFYTELRKRSKHLDRYTFKDNYDYVQKLIKRINKGGRTYPIIEGVENLPASSTMVVSNHQGRYDGIAVLTALKDKPSSFLALLQRTDHPMYSEVFKCLDGVFIDPTNPRSYAQSINEITKHLERGISMIVFPEGGYEDNGNNLQEFKTGAFKSAYDAKVAITPIVLYDSWKVYGKSSIKKIYPIIHILKPIEYNDFKDMTRQDLSNYIKNLMQEEINKIENSKR